MIGKNSAATTAIDPDVVFAEIELELFAAAVRTNQADLVSYWRCAHIGPRHH